MASFCEFPLLARNPLKLPGGYRGCASALLMAGRGWKTGLAGAENIRMIMTMLEILLIAAGSLVVIVPLFKERRSIRRLEELRAGAPEVYFEERRSLEAYPPKGSWLPRFIGAAIVIYYTTSLVMKHAS
jgi:hypothetical protein